ncbi:MAG: hypothetical protein JWO13_1294 [Acidobacteriales bacterium]|nr:hypothetical protein [Terriglobales bacterium]
MDLESIENEAGGVELALKGVPPLPPKNANMTKIRSYGSMIRIITALVKVKLGRIVSEAFLADLANLRITSLCIIVVYENYGSNDKQVG